MEAMTRAVWGFMEGAHRNGLLDDLLALLGGLSDPGADLGEMMAGFEDALMGSDLASFEALSGSVLLPALEALSEERVLEDLHVVVRAARPLLEGAVQRAGGDVKAVTAAAGDVGNTLRAAQGVARALLPVLARVYGPSLRGWLLEQAGSSAGRLVNALTRSVAENPDTARRVLSDLWATVDGRAFRRAADILVGAFLDRRPPLVEWTATTLAGRARKRIFGKGRRRDGNG